MNRRLLWLFLRSRLAGWGVLGLGVVSGVFAIWGIYQPSDETSVIALVAAPLTMAVVIVSTTYAPFGETEWTASRPLRPLRFGQLVGMLVVATAGLLAAAPLWPEEGGSLMLARNLLGIVGIGLIVALPLGTSLAWIGPALAAFLALFVNEEDISQKPLTLVWTWPVRMSSDTGAVLIALLLLVAGMIAYAQRPPRNTVDELH